MIIIGIDSSTVPHQTGVALGTFEKGKLTVNDVKVGSNSELPEVIITDWLLKECPILLALDAPLGWPSSFGEELSVHSAGMLLKGDSDNLFRRTTDKVVKNKTGQLPLDIGSNLIARTAHWALQLLNKLRLTTETSVPLAWSIDDIHETCAIEVYPAATLRVRNIPNKGYKEKKDSDHKTQRKRMLDKLSEHMTINTTIKDACISDANALDAVICLLAASDFLQGKCIQPDDLELAKKEGWIWVRNPKL